MITFKNRQYNGNFTYSKDSKGSLTVDGFFATDDKGNIANISIYYSGLGSVSAYRDVENERFEYSIKVTNLSDTEVILQSVETIINEITDEILIENEIEQEKEEEKEQQEEQEEEPAEQEQGKKK